MILALLMAMTAATLFAIWTGRTAYAALFGVTVLGAALIFVFDIGTPLTLAF